MIWSPKIFFGRKWQLGDWIFPALPVLAMSAYFAIAPASDAAPLFCYSDRTPLRRSAFVNDIRKLLVAARIPNHGHYSGHSFCIGAATSAALCGTPKWLVRAMGRWESATSGHRQARFTKWQCVSPHCSERTVSQTSN